MVTRSGGPPIKNIRKVKPGPDQAFTLPKGTSAAPIMTKRMYVIEKALKAGVKPNTIKKAFSVGGGSARKQIADKVYPNQKGPSAWKARLISKFKPDKVYERSDKQFWERAIGSTSYGKSFGKERKRGTFKAKD